MSSLTIGTLTGILRMDEDDFRRGLANGQLRMRSFQRDLNSRLRDLHHSTREWARNLGNDLDESEGGSTRLHSALGRIVGMAGGLGGIAASFAKIGLMIGAAVPLAAGLAAAIAHIAPAAGLAATGIVAIQLATNTLKLGMQGVGEAVKAALDPEAGDKFNEAIKKLAPNARAFALEVKKLSPEFKKIQQDVQNRMFAKFDQVARDMGKFTLPPLRKGLRETADVLNIMGRGVANAAVRMGKNGTLGEAIHGATAGLKNLSRIPGQIVTGLTQVAAAAAPAFARLTKPVGLFFDRFAAQIQQAFDSGHLTKAIDAAIDTIGQLGRVIGNVLGGLVNIFKAVSTEGGGLFGTLEKITQAFQDLTATKEFQGALKELSKTVGTLVSTVLPLLAEAFKAILPIVKILAPPIRELIKHLGEALKPVIQALAPVLAALATAFAKLIPALTPIIGLAARLITAILPILTPLFVFLGEVFERLTPVVEELANNIASELEPILAVLPGILDQILPPFLELADRLLPLLVDVLVQIGPQLGQLAVAMADLLVQLTPLIVKFLELQIFLLDKLLPIIGPLVVGLGSALVGALMLLTDFINQFVIPAVKTIVALFNGDWKAASQNAVTFTNNLRDNAAKAFESLKTRGTQAVGQLASDVVRRARGMASDFIAAVQRLVNGAIARIGTLPGRILRAVPNAGGLLYGIGQAIINGLIRGINAGIGRLSGALSNISSMIPGTVRSLLGIHSPSRVMAGLGENVTQGFIQGIASGMPALQSQMEAMSMAVPGLGMGGAGGAAVPAGPQRMRIELSGPEEFRRLIRRIVQDGGGNVQTVFGQ